MPQPKPHAVMPVRARLVGDGLNKGERRYADHLETLRRTGEIRDWKAKPFKLRLADNTFYEPDFAFIARDLTLTVAEYKGFWRDDARVKIKVAAEQFPWFRFIAVTEPKRGQFVTEAIPPHDLPIPA